MENCNHGVKLVGAMLVGAAVGGALGILFAPNSGKDTRKKIIGSTEDVADDIKGHFNDFLREVKREMDSVKNKADEMIEVGKNKMK